MAGRLVLAADAVPASRVDSVTDTLHGKKITDPYRWLEDQGSADTRAWIDAQNQYTQAYLARIEGRDKLRQRIEALRRYDTRSIPIARAGSSPHSSNRTRWYASHVDAYPAISP